MCSEITTHCVNIIIVERHTTVYNAKYKEKVEVNRLNTEIKYFSKIYIFIVMVGSNNPMVSAQECEASGWESIHSSGLLVG